MPSQNPPIVYLVNKKDALEYYNNKKGRICKVLNLKRHQMDQLPLVTIRGERYFDEHVSLRIHYLSAYRVPIRAFEFRKQFFRPIKSIHDRDKGTINMDEDFLAMYPATIREAIVRTEDPTLEAILEALHNAMASSHMSYKEQLESIGVDMICEIIIKRLLSQFCFEADIPMRAVSKWMRSPGNKEAFDDAIYMSGLVLSDQAVEVAMKWLPTDSDLIKNKKIMTDTLSRESANKMRQKKVDQVSVAVPIYNYFTVKDDD